MTEEETRQYMENIAEERHKRITEKKEKKVRQRARALTGPRLVIDLSFDELMKPTELKSLTSQVRRSYGAVMHMESPFHLCLVSDGPSHVLTTLSGYDDATQWPATFSTEGLAAIGAEHLVYLSADADTVLSDITLEPTDVLVVGGLVDKNRHKNVCNTRAEALGARTACLPDEILRERSFRVLTTNQVVEILAKVYDVDGEWTGRADDDTWRAAIGEVLPRRRAG